MKNELQRIMYQYFQEEYTTICFYGDESRIQEIMHYFDRIIQYDKPDAYSIVDGKLFMLECFEFDSSNRSSNGSKQKREEANDDRLFQRIEPSEEGTFFRNVLSTDYTIDNYRKNATSTFLTHYNRIDTYKKHLIDDGIIKPETDSIMAFFIEDTTLLGNIYEVDSWEKPTHPLFLPCCDFFLDLFEHSPNLDCVFCGSWACGSHHLWFIDRTMIANFRDNQIHTEDLTLCDFTPHSVGYKIIVPNDTKDN